ncbi:MULTISPECIES: SAM-dependent methyltransferase [Thermomonosporaceae]|uniref:SAM-dependent methyltransferase n=1 Tax=Thermomonosporaceae TaxID=2012 RepID=UPI00255AED2E|nr:MULTISPECIES: SAM-dependent methyltransferase [Thermomonosporaceae]MDL4774677.1 SAM-dependent methyltransferase [Actinomadura xylanilytica]
MTERDAPDLGFGSPAASRIYDFSLGGKDNYGPDREAAIRAFQTFPAARLLPRENRKFMRRAVRHLVDAGITQFLDIGCGLPGKGNVHQVAADADVVYVDHDPVAVVHYQALLHAVPRATAVRADARRPHEILAHPEVTALIDFGRPVAVLMTAVLDLITDADDPEATVRAFRDAMAPGGHLVVCDLTDAVITPAERDTAAELVRANGVAVSLRPPARIAGYFDGFELLEPGLVNAPEWRPDRPHEPASGWLLAGVGRKP